MKAAFTAPILSMETALGAASVCVWENGEIRAAWKADSAFDNAKQLMNGVEQTLNAAGLTYDGLGALACSVGPGSFTGLRVGLAAARALALATSLPLVPVTTLDALLARYQNTLKAEGWAMINAQRGQVYAQPFVREKSYFGLTGAPMLLDYADACAHASGQTLIGNASEALLNAVEHMPDATKWSTGLPDATDIARVAAHMLAQPGFVAYEATPVYVRAPDAKLPTKK